MDNNLSFRELLNMSNDIRNFFLRNIKMFKPPIKVRHNDWPKILAELESKGYQTDPFYGKCCPVSHFLLFLTGGKESNVLELKMSKPKVFVRMEDRELKTTHWWVSCSQTGLIIDLTSSQFIYGINVDIFHKDGIKADVGYPYFRKNGKKSIRYNENVPTRQVLEFARKFKEEFGTCYGLQVWLDRFDSL